MPDLVSLLLPTVVVLLVAVALVVGVVVAVRLARRSPRARRAALAERSRAASAVARLDAALTDLDLDLALSGALADRGAPATVRRGRMTGQHVRDDALAELRAAGPDRLPVDIRRAAHQVEASTSAALAEVARARRDHDGWVRRHVSPVDLLAAARARLAETRAALGDPAALLDELSGFDPVEWRAAAATAADASRAADEAQARLDAAAGHLADPTADARPDLEAAERALRRAALDEQSLEETHRLVIDAARAVPGELSAARSALDDARTIDRGSPRLDAIEASLAELARTGRRRPLATVHDIALLRLDIDETLGDRPTTQQRVRSARTALPGTLAAARAALSRVETARDRGHDGDALLILADAQHELAEARGADDVHLALAAARRALRAADQAAGAQSREG